MSIVPNILCLFFSKYAGGGRYVIGWIHGTLWSLYGTFTEPLRNLYGTFTEPLRNLYGVVVRMKDSINDQMPR